MASHFEEEDNIVKECANCGSKDSLGRCSRCHQAWFCSLKCQKAYWPFHKEWCTRNDFADVIEKHEPKFAKWMRKHGKQAVLKDDEVNRLERKVATMEDMYGKADPKPLPPAYTSEDLKKMVLAEEQSLLEDTRQTREDKYWREICIPENLGLQCPKYKWRQNQSYVEVYVQLPAGTKANAIVVELQTNSLSVTIEGQTYLRGDLYAPIKQDMSVWVIHEQILEVVMLKRNRKNQYEDKKTNADTFWYSVFWKGRPEEVLQLKQPPIEYYSSEFEREEKPLHKRVGKYAGK
mmetsp:Transcript_10172/g.21196  ORF Transcript_10172/g.21196 Transcript_10172/m.21196 type:complete len:291 (-) Transcript_10172:157-1029(-)|eukprot:CAMPEP_0118924398 /NCGR_PEP_ID=MMETSP1169-20130426/2552_1 /TAXON_ID=36882 /ORGANISM="Pyramimonas obovata, Strain CCMP722" /LENGTH=290 /DNA_ID=CAMNT_0006865507 /DNA_START=260 /DNA_END=1132 /DNA_ORIENTATION=-